MSNIPYGTPAPEQPSLLDEWKKVLTPQEDRLYRAFGALDRLQDILSEEAGPTATAEQSNLWDPFLLGLQVKGWDVLPNSEDNNTMNEVLLGLSMQSTNRKLFEQKLAGLSAFPGSKQMLDFMFEHVADIEVTVKDLGKTALSMDVTRPMLALS